MRSSIVKRSIVLQRHKTSVSLEDPFWNDLKQIARDHRMTLSELVNTIDGPRGQGNLSSAIRLFVLNHFRNQKRRDGCAVGSERTPDFPSEKRHGQLKQRPTATARELKP
jgi:predicted DNA-binding ribbon-helix-helix protein